ncbi:MAG TPA: hypothetical protein VM260_16990 [Pirellula sp.]|nr:hypothetical protein [Pirellula sp.]
MKFDLYVIDLLEKTFVSAPSGMSLDFARSMAEGNPNPNFLTVVVPEGYEIVNREERARKLGAIYVQGKFKRLKQIRLDPMTTIRAKV